MAWNLHPDRLGPAGPHSGDSGHVIRKYRQQKQSWGFLPGGENT